MKKWPANTFKTRTKEKRVVCNQIGTKIKNYYQWREKHMKKVYLQDLMEQNKNKLQKSPEQKKKIVSLNQENV